MNVLYGNANTLTLPYVLDGIPGRFTFVPGKNEIRPEIWKAIYGQNKARFDADYSRHLRVFQPTKVEEFIIPGKEDDPVRVELGSDAVDFISLTDQSAFDLIQNTMDLDELNGYLAAENGKKRPRKVVVKAIKDKIEEIEQFDARRSESQE